MKEKKAFLALAVMLTLLGWGCRKDVVEIRPYPDTLTELSMFLLQVPDQGASTSFHFNSLNEDKILTIPTGGRLFLTDVNHLFVLPGTDTPVAASNCADLKIEVTIAKSKGDILARGLPTITTEHELLQTGGMVLIKASCDGSPLDLAPGRELKIQIPAADPQDDMFVYEAAYNSGGFKGWSSTGQEVYKADWPAPGGSGTVEGYELVATSLGWVHCARLLSNAQTSSFCTNLPSSFTGLNTKAYLVLDHFPVVVPLQFDDASHSFCFPKVPAGYPTRVVTVGKTDTDYWLGANATETGTGTQLMMQPQTTTAADILGYLRGL